MYVARIVGEDHTFRLKRTFLTPEVSRVDENRQYTYTLGDGVYEITYSRYEIGKKEPTERMRSLVFLLEGRAYSFSFEELDEKFILQSVFNHWMQLYDHDLACRLFFRKGSET